jgi:two-component system LytT family response regulator
VTTPSLRVVLVDDEPLARQRLRGFLATHHDVEIVGEAGDGVSAVELIRATRPNLLFLDVKMPELDGFGVLRRLKGDGLPITIFVTAYDQYALRAFEVFALDYLLKPFRRARLDEALERARAIVARRDERALGESLRALLDHLGAGTAYLDRLTVRVGDRLVPVKVERIDWISAEDNYVRLHVGKTAYLLRETMNGLEAKLDPARFLRIHRATIVNVDRVRELRPWFHRDYKVVLEDGTEVVLSRTYRQRAGRLLKG